MAIDNLVDNRPQLLIDLIRTDGGTQPRAELNQTHLEELVELLNDGRTFKDPVVVFYDGSNYWLADGFHRLNATKIAGLRYVDIDVRSGTHENAVEFSCGANATHGLRRTNDDKRRAVNRLLTLPKWQEKSNRDIARQCGVTEHLVRIIRSELPEDHPAATRSQKATNPPVEPVETDEEVRIRTADIDAEKRKKVVQFFEDFPTLWHLSNREIARRCDVTEGLVRKIRKELQDEQERAEQEAAKVAEPEPVVEPTPEPEPIESIADPVIAMDTPATLDDTEDDDDHDYGDEEDEEDYYYWNPHHNEDDEVEDITAPVSEPEQPIEEHTIVTPEPEPESQESQDTAEDQTPTLPPEAIEALAAHKREREAKRQQVEERNEQLREKGVDLPIGKYSCIVIDPPWQMQKIEREERPNQMGFDYPTMTEKDLEKFPLPDLAADNCHLYLWVTQKHLPLALRLAEHWGFKYQCIMTWVKNVGFTPFSWMYTTEHVLFCTKGSLPLLAIGKRLDFGGRVREHSRKPDEFYALVKEVSPGPRIDVFSREKRDGFDQYGNEVEKYVSA